MKNVLSDNCAPGFILYQLTEWNSSTINSAHLDRYRSYEYFRQCMHLSDESCFLNILVLRTKGTNETFN